MFVLKLDTNKTLTLTKKSVNYVLENNAEKIWCLFPCIINDINLSECKIILKMLNQDNVDCEFILAMDEELYNNYIQCYIPITKDWTYKAGNIILWLNIIRSTNEIVLKTNEVIMDVHESKNAEGNLPEQSQSLISQLLIDVGNKADGLSYVNNILQLKSGDTLIGNQVTILGGSGDESITYIGKSPYIDETTGNWFEWNDINNSYSNTGIKAEGQQGIQGTSGVNGINGLSAYQIAVNGGYIGTESAWLLTLKGEQGIQGNKGDTGLQGLSAYQVAVNNGFVGTESEWINSLNGSDGVNGLSAYQIAVNNGYIGTESEWLLSLKGVKGDTGETGITGDSGTDGLSAYQVWLSLGNTGTEAEFITSLKGVKGDIGDTGATGSAGTGVVNQRTNTELSLWAGSQAQYTALGTYDSNTVYLISG